MLFIRKENPKTLHLVFLCRTVTCAVSKNAIDECQSNELCTIMSHMNYNNNNYFLVHWKISGQFLQHTLYNVDYFALHAHRARIPTHRVFRTIAHAEPIVPVSCTPHTDRHYNCVVLYARTSKTDVFNNNNMYIIVTTEAAAGI